MNRTLSLALAALLTACGGSEPTATSAPVERVSRSTPTPTPTEAPDVVVEQEQVETFLSEAVAVSPDPATEAVEPEVPATTFSLRRGETLAHFGRWSGRTVEEVAASSALDLDGVYPVGTEVALVLTPEERSTLEGRRDDHHQRRSRAYLSSRDSTNTEFYAVKTGDSAWTIANDRLGMPVWLLESMNPSVDLDRLRPGQELLVPVFQDTVVQLEAPEMEEASDRLPADPEPLEVEAPGTP